MISPSTSPWIADRRDISLVRTLKTGVMVHVISTFTARRLP